MKHLKVLQKYSAACRIFKSLLSVSSGDETLHPGLKIATDTVANATNIFSLATENSGLVAKVATRF